MNVGRCSRQRDVGQRWAGMFSVVVNVEVGECDWHKCNRREVRQLDGKKGKRKEGTVQCLRVYIA